MTGRLVPAALACLCLLLSAGCLDGSAQERITLKVIPAGSLLGPFATIEEDFEALHPEVDVQIEGHGSIQAVRQVTDLHRAVDVVAVADESLIPDMMYRPMEGSDVFYADEYARIGTNEVVIAYTGESLYADEIDAANWYAVLARPDVRVGFSNPMLDACGYRTFMVVVLAEDYYDQEGLFDALIGDHLQSPVTVTADNGVTRVALPEFLKPATDKLAIRDGSIYLLSLLEAGGIDYAFEYKSVAIEHGLSWVDLPPEVDLGSGELADAYAAVEVKLSFARFSSIGDERQGRPIVYAITVPNNAPHPAMAEEFVAFVEERFAEGRYGWPEPMAH
ncbi:MAG: tungstate ABC transporter substrate-binding protein WtpA [Methanomicrobiaceae archaeon]|nr:tungstate ABC transporter substrate-binding protein WtpA [Methanomicrobiaceae archaeon]